MENFGIKRLPMLLMVVLNVLLLLLLVKQGQNMRELAKNREYDLGELRTKICGVKDAQPEPVAAIVVPAAKTVEPEAKPVAESEPTKADAAVQPEAEKAGSDFRISARISAIEKFVPLNDDQRERLRDSLADRKSPEAEKQQLEDILGKENADYYADQAKQAFVNAETEETDREVYYQSRKLGLSTEQEDQFRVAIAKTEAGVRDHAALQKPSAATDMQAKLRAMMEDSALRQRMLNAELEKILSAEQFRRYVESQAGSADSDFGVWHGE